jgi:hypothetical protein
MSARKIKGFPFHFPVWYFPVPIHQQKNAGQENEEVPFYFPVWYFPVPIHQQKNARQENEERPFHFPVRHLPVSRKLCQFK